MINLQKLKKEMLGQSEAAHRDSTKILDEARLQARHVLAEAATGAAKVPFTDAKAS
jgi:hypothetical protein